MPISYERAPSKKLKELLSTGGLLAPLLDLTERQVCGLPLDTFFGVEDKVCIYCGLTRLIEVKRTSNGTVKVTAHKTYGKQSCADGFFRHWNINEHIEFEKSLDRYLSRVEVDRRFTKSEGLIQSLWSRVTECWVTFDREATLSYSSQKESKIAREYDQVESARVELEAVARSASPLWALPSSSGREVDLLAVDSNGSLVLVELKNASARADSVFYTPFQLLSYILEWCNAIESVLEQLQALLDSRVELGITPGSVPALTGDIRAAVCFGPDTRSNEVKRRYSEVLEVVSKYLPRKVPLIDTWTLEDLSNSPQLVCLT